MCVFVRTLSSGPAAGPVQGVLSSAPQGSGKTKITGFWSGTMAQVCDVCGKKPQFGNNISHAHNVTRRRWNVNLQAVKALVNGASKRIRVCTSCIKSGKVAKA
jgi:large subunit ribosomal protein L28